MDVFKSHDYHVIYLKTITSSDIPSVHDSIAAGRSHKQQQSLSETTPLCDKLYKLVSDN